MGAFGMGGRGACVCVGYIVVVLGRLEAPSRCARRVDVVREGWRWRIAFRCALRDDVVRDGWVRVSATMVVLTGGGIGRLPGAMFR